jgi:AraC-like DNA-binding protein
MVDLTPRIVLPSRSATVKYACADAEPMPVQCMNYAFGHWAVVLVRGGRGEISHAGHRFAVEPGTLICSPPGFVSIDLSDDPDLIVISLEERGSAESEMWRPFAIPLVRKLEPAHVRAWTERLVICERKVAAGVLSDADVRSLKNAFMDCFWLESRPSSQRIVHETFGTLQREMERITSLHALASGMGYTRNHLSDTMRDLTGVSLSSWLTGMRMARARDVLAADDVPIADVGAAVGYDDAAYFSRVFRRYHGVPPQHWRIAHRPDDARWSSVIADPTMFDQFSREVA